VEATLQGNSCSAPASLNRLALLDSVINETLRLLPPNALMLRITTKPMSFDGIQLPAHCEVILSPFVSHRDKTCFPRPDEFLPGRWRGMPPSPFVYFPFGAGGHACVGRAITMDLLKTALIFLLPRFDVLLTEDQDLDWVMRIMLLPSPDPIVAFYPFHSQVSPTPKKAGAISGALAGLLNFQNASPAS
jgi:cytochrome P450